MRQALIYYKNDLAGMLMENDDRTFVFRYDDQYFDDENKNPISLTLPKTQQKYQSPHLFPFFSNMLSEGANRRLQSRLLKVDETDEFSLLISTASIDAIGAIAVKKIQS